MARKDTDFVEPLPDYLVDKASLFQNAQQGSCPASLNFPGSLAPFLLRLLNLANMVPADRSFLVGNERRGCRIQSAQMLATATTYV